MAFDPSRPFAMITRTATMVESQVAIIPMVKAAAGRHGGPTVASYHCSQMPFIWLLPFIAEKATGAERDLLLTLIRHASAHQPEHRPSFAEMVDHLDRFEHQKRGPGN